MAEVTPDDGDTPDDREGDAGGSPTIRTTAPQSEYTAKQITTGFVIALVGLAVTFGVPLAVLF